MSFDLAESRCRAHIKEAEDQYNNQQENHRRSTIEVCSYLLKQLGEHLTVIKNSNKPEELPELVFKCKKMADSVQMILEYAPQSKQKKQPKSKKPESSEEKSADNKQSSPKNANSGHKKPKKEAPAPQVDEGLLKVKRELEALHASRAATGNTATSRG